MNIFRKEAIESKRLDWIGNHSLTLAKPSFSLPVTSLTTLGIIVSLITFGSYEINVQASGLVAYRPGIYTLTSPLEGLVTIAKKNEGEKVSKGEYLFTITNRISQSGEEKYKKKEVLIREKITNLENRTASVTTSLYRVKNDYLQQNLLKRDQLSTYQQILITFNKKLFSQRTAMIYLPGITKMALFLKWSYTMRRYNF